MKKIIVIFIYFLSGGCTEARKDATKPTLELEKGSIPLHIDTMRIVAEINERYLSLNNKVPSFREIRRDLKETESSEGGEILKYYDGDEVKKITTIHYGAMGKSIVDYYLSDQQVFFVHRQDVYYDKPTYIEGYEVDRTEENKFFFHDGSLIKWVTPDSGHIKPDSPAFREKEKEILNIKFISS